MSRYHCSAGCRAPLGDEAVAVMLKPGVISYMHPECVPAPKVKAPPREVPFVGTAEIKAQEVRRADIQLSIGVGNDADVVAALGKKLT